MIIVRSPLRISLGGGGTDLPSYYRRFGGSLVAAAIDKYVYITVHRSFSPEIIAKYSRLERVATVGEVQHPILREAMRLLDVGPPVEIVSIADIPAGTGLGSSGSFTTALVRGLCAHQRRLVQPREVAELACQIEIDRLAEPVGKQDQYIAAFGGLTCFTFNPDDTVEAVPLAIPTDALHQLEDDLLLFFTGYSRSASAVLADQDEKSKSGDGAMLANLHRVKELGEESRAAMEAGDLRRFAELMDIHWLEKQKRSPDIAGGRIAEWYALGRRSGALGGKLVGAGGGGFLLFYAEDRARLRAAMAAAGLQEVRFRFDFEGTKVVAS